MAAGQETDGGIGSGADGETVAELEARIERAARRGVRVVDPRQTWIGADVDLARLCPGATLHPGTRLSGPRLFLSPGAEVGHEGPATLFDCAFGERARIASGYAAGAVLLAGASAGANAHLRPGTLLEEGASTAHAVGLKQTILLSHVTLGSLINFCDCLMAGGTSRRDHSEVGSGFIHFNFTPWGERGDKATPSLFGDAVRGVFLREQRIFLGGSAGAVGPVRVGYGSVTAAGQVQRGDVAEGHLASTPLRAVDRPVDIARKGAVEPRAGHNVEYLAQLAALRAWYREVRLVRARADHERAVLEAAVTAIELCWRERARELARFLEERGEGAPEWLLPDAIPPCPLDPEPDGRDHVAWVQSLPDDAVVRGRAWLDAVADGVRRLRPPD